MLAPSSQRGGPIIWPLAAKLRHALFMQQRPKWTGGLRVEPLPVLPWNNAARPPAINYGAADVPPTVADTLPVNMGLAALNLVPIPQKQFLHPQRPRTYYEQFRLPSTVRQPMPPAEFFQISGQTKDSAGAPLGGCTVDLFVTATDVRIETVTSNADGYFYFKSPAQAATHYVVAYKAGAPDVAGTTLNTLVGT